VWLCVSRMGGQVLPGADGGRGGGYYHSKYLGSL